LCDGAETGNIPVLMAETTSVMSDEDEARDPATGSGVLGGFRAAVMVLTRVPMGRVVGVEGRRWAAGWIPLVGAALGALGAGLLALLEPLLGGRLAAAVTVGLLLLLTGAIHEDGLADTADALGGARDREGVFAILKDSRVGTYGVLAVVIVLLLRIETLARLQAQAPAAYLLAAVLSRAPMVWLMSGLPYVTPAAVARSADVVAVRPAAMMLATVTAVAVAAGVAALGWQSPSAVTLAPSA
jgi:adenosylcobinamide-GDP ribazoletransferase